MSLTGADTKVATFVMPDTNKPLAFKLKAKAGADVVSTDTVLVTKVDEVLTISRAELRTRTVSSVSTVRLRCSRCPTWCRSMRATA